MASGMAAATLLDNKVVDIVWLSSRPINGDSPSKARSRLISSPHSSRGSRRLLLPPPRHPICREASTTYPFDRCSRNTLGRFFWNLRSHGAFFLHIMNILGVEFDGDPPLIRGEGGVPSDPNNVLP